MIYTVTLNPALDHTVDVGELCLGTVNRAVAGRIDPGGKGINVSIILHRLGMETTALGFSAGETGMLLEGLVREQGVGAEWFHVPGMTRINSKLKGRKETDINCPGPDIPQEACAHLLERLDGIADGDGLVLSGSVPASMPKDIYVRMLARVRGRRVLTVVDAEGRLLRETLPYHPFLIKPNREELEMLFGRKLAERREISQCAGELQRAGARNVLVSLGADGALLLAEDGTCTCLPVPDGHAVNTVGAGDSMVAGFVYQYQRTGDVRESLRFSVCCGSATAFQPGLAKRDQILELSSAFFPDALKGVRKDPDSAKQV